MLKNVIARLGSKIVIFLGAIFFVVSVIVLYTNVEPKSGDLVVYLSHQTEYIDGVNGDQDTLFFGAEKKYRSYLNSLQSDTSIILLDTSQHKVDRKKYTYKRPHLLFDQEYYSSDSSGLYTLIDSLDRYYSDSLALISTEKKHFFNHHPRLLLWILMMSIAIGFSFCLLPLCTYKAKEINQGADLGLPVYFLLSAILVFCLFLPQIRSGNTMFFIPVDMVSTFGFGVKKPGLFFNMTAPFAGMLAWIVLVFVIIAKIDRLKEQINEEEVKSSVVAEFSQIRSTFEGFFFIVALFLAYTLICNQTLIESLNALVNPTNDFKLFPTEFAFINGIMQTSFLALIYFVFNITFKSARKKILEEAPQEIITQYDLEKENKTTKDLFAQIITILAPVIGSGILPLLEAIFNLS